MRAQWQLHLPHQPLPSSIHIGPYCPLRMEFARIIAREVPLARFGIDGSCVSWALSE